jgi:hypothetical protein
VTEESHLNQLRQQVRYLMDRTEIVDCISPHSRGHDRHDADLILLPITTTAWTSTAMR